MDGRRYGYGVGQLGRRIGGRWIAGAEREIARSYKRQHDAAERRGRERMLDEMREQLGCPVAGDETDTNNGMRLQEAEMEEVTLCTGEELVRGGWAGNGAWHWGCKLERCGGEK